MTHTGHIPPQLGQLGALQYLSLCRNKLDGHIPRGLGDLGALKNLNLDLNKLEGHIPPELGALSKLRNLWLSSNKLTGSVPAQFVKLCGLDALLLGGNLLSGPVPSLGELRMLYAAMVYPAGSALSTMMQQRTPHGKDEATTTEDHLYDDPDTHINARMAAMLGQDETGAVQGARDDETMVGEMAGAALAKKGGRTTATSGETATTGGEPRYSEDKRLKIGTTHTSSQMSSLQDFKGDVVAWSFGNRAEVLRSPDSEFELEVQPGLNKNYPALVGLGLCSGSAEYVNGEQYLLHCVLTCLTRAGEKFDPPLLLRFPVGDEDSMESGSLDGSQDDAEEAYRAHLQSTFSAVKRDDASSEWVPIGGDIVRMKGGRDFFLEVKISHFCDFGLSQAIDVEVGYTELIELPKKMFSSRKTHYHFANLGTKPLVFHVWGAGRKEVFVNVVRANAAVDLAGGSVGAEMERTLVDVPGSGPYEVHVPGEAGSGSKPQVCRKFVDLEKPTVAWTTQERISPSSGVEGHQLVQVWGSTPMLSGHVLVVGAMAPDATPAIANLRVDDGEDVGRLVWSKKGNT
ncbi:unnamed protein product [Ectocarpus sp. CCAP 1310/34]|nr:unnamed protein product [Ectocarpus sp. CCAP 1310/34]